MTQVAQMVNPSIETEVENSNPSTESNKIVFTGSHRNMAVGVAMFATAALAFSMNLTTVFFCHRHCLDFCALGSFVYLWQSAGCLPEL